MALTRYFSSIQFKLMVGCGLTLILMIVAIVYIAQTTLRSQLEKNSLSQIEASGAKIVDELVRRITLANTLAESIANAATSINNEQQMLATLPKILDLHQEKQLIAGGGYWPEPHAFNHNSKRSSFFWGRNKEGVLKYYNDYNKNTGTGYHNEEWYVPARYLKPGQCYWSRSYIDPYSKQPIVSCTVAITQENKFTGASTVDLKLEGLQKLFKKSMEGLDGYAFAVDQNNTFITFPDRHLVANTDGTGLTVHELQEKNEQFSALSDELERLTKKLLADAKSSSKNTNISANLVKSSYQIDEQQAEVIAAALADPYQQLNNHQILSRISLDFDPVFNEPSTALIFHVPGAYWKVVVVISKYQVFDKVHDFIAQIIKITLLPLVLITLIAFFSMRYIVITPIVQFTNVLKASTTSSKKLSAPSYLDDTRKDELGDLAYWYNRRTHELEDTMDKLSDANDELHFHANYDLLTHLPNRRDFETHLQRLANGKEWGEYSLLYLDIDLFKIINDTCGHVAGDQLLLQVSKILSSVIRDTDVLARIGGDEFALIIKTGGKRKLAEITAKRILSTIQHIKFNWEEKVFNITCSIGGLNLVDVENEVATALKYVDNACYVAKDAGRNRIHIYEDSDTTLSEREGEMNWLSKINNALNKDLFVIEFQLIASTSPEKGHLPSTEALIRMKGPDGKIIPPGFFLPAAERYNAIYHIDQWMVDNTMKTIKDKPNLINRINYFSINLSADSLCHDGIVEYIQERCSFYNIPTNKICFEITETQVMMNLSYAKNTLHKLRDIGFKVALDDFGAGMSSFGYLTELPIDSLKIDGCFVKDIMENDIHRVFVKAMTQIAAAMGLKTIAEFVEDKESIALLKKIGVDYVQGYGIAKPQSIEQLEALLFTE